MWLHIRDGLCTTSGGNIQRVRDLLSDQLSPASSSFSVLSQTGSVLQIFLLLLGLMITEDKEALLLVTQAVLKCMKAADHVTLGVAQLRPLTLNLCCFRLRPTVSLAVAVLLDPGNQRSQKTGSSPGSAPPAPQSGGGCSSHPREDDVTMV